MFANNKAVNWLKPKTETEMADFLRTARTKAPEFQKLFQHCWKLMLEERAKRTLLQKSEHMRGRRD